MKTLMIKNNDYISAYTSSNKIVEGVVTSFKGNKVVLTESGEWYGLNSLKLVKVVEDNSSKIADIVKGDVERLNDEKVKNTSDSELEKTAKERAKELSVKEDDYVNAFVTAAKAKAAADDIAKGNTTESKALEGLINESKYPELAGNFEEEDDFDIDEYLATPLKDDDHPCDDVSFEDGFECEEPKCEEIVTEEPGDVISFADIYNSSKADCCSEKCETGECDCGKECSCHCHDRPSVSTMDIMSVIEKIIDEYTDRTKSFEPRDCYCLICRRLEKPQCIEFFDESMNLSKAIMKLTESL